MGLMVKKRHLDLLEGGIYCPLEKKCKRWGKISLSFVISYSFFIFLAEKNW
jgi:hypothetical protein